MTRMKKLYVEEVAPKKAKTSEKPETSEKVEEPEKPDPVTKSEEE